MPPPGRRRTFSSTPNIALLFTTLILLLLQQASAQSAVLGLDIGTEYLKAALVKPGIPLDIVLTKDSRRKEAAAIGFKPVRGSQDATQLSERLYGADALAVAARFPSDVYPNLKPLLGSILDTGAAVNAYRRRFPGLDLKQDGSEKDFLGFQSKNEQDPFFVEELLAMEMSSIKHNAEAMAGSGFAIRNAVITVPTFYTVDERRAIQLAAELAGLNVMSLMSDGLAVGLNYAISRTFPNIDKGEKAEHHLVYDMGAGSTTATILRFQARTVRDVGKFNKTIQEVNVIGTGYDRSLGGDTLNELIVDDMIEKFATTTAAKAQNLQVTMVKNHGRTMAKLWREAERLRQVLSANSATSANFEGLYEDVDFRYKLSRSDFESMAATYGSRVSKPLKEALATAKLSITELDSIVLHGGMVRTPLVQKELEAQVGDPAKLRSNVNADEAAVFGAAFRAAGLSPSFRVKDIKSNDVANYVTTISWTSKSKPRQQNIFLPTSQAGTVKQMPFSMTEDFELLLTQQVPSTSTTSETGDRGITHVKVANLTASIAELEKLGCTKADIKTLLSMRLDPVLGVPEVSAGTVSCEIDPSEKKGGVVDNVKGLFGFGGKKEQEPLVDGAASLGDTTETVSESASSSSFSSATSSPASSSSSASAKSKSKEPAPPKKQTKIINLALETSRTDLRQPSASKLTAMKARLAAYDQSDLSRRQREESFNALEASTYRTRDLLTDQSFQSVSTPPQRDEISALIATTSDWLHEDGISASIDVIKEKQAGLKALVDPILKRKAEITNRPQAVKGLEEALNQTSALITSIRESIDKAAEAAASSASSLAEAATASPSEDSSATPSGSEPSEAPAPEAEAEASPNSSGLDDLEDATAAPSPSKSAKPSPSSSIPPFTMPTPSYTEADYTTLSDLYATTKSWLAEQSESQNALPVSEEPVLSAKDVKAKTKEVEKALEELALRTFDFKNMPDFEKLFGDKFKGGAGGGTGGSGGKKGKASSKKSKGKGKSTKSAKGSKSSTSSGSAEPSPTAVAPDPEPAPESVKGAETAHVEL